MSQKTRLPYKRELSFDGTSIEVFSSHKIVIVNKNPALLNIRFNGITGPTIQMASQGNNSFAPFNITDFACTDEKPKRQVYNYANTQLPNQRIMVAFYDILTDRTEPWAVDKKHLKFSSDNRQLQLQNIPPAVAAATP